MRNHKFYYPLSLFFVFILIFISCSDNEQISSREYDFALAIHGGAGTIKRDSMSSDVEAEYRAKLHESLQKGYAVLENGGSSLDAVIAAITIMEDSPLFNAGKGAVFTHNGLNELDASIMDGKTLKAGAVGAIRNVKNPIGLARLVMEKTWHVLLIGNGARLFAEEQGVELVSDEYFFTKRRWDSLQNALKKQSDEDRSGLSINSTGYLGTVGAVALDKNGNLAAGTSTGGMTNKLYGRVGDSPIIGAGTYANNKTCAVSGTGQGEYFIRGMIAYDISAMMEYSGKGLEEVSHEVIMNKLTAMGGTGGVISIDSDGNISMPFNTSGMYRAYHRAGEEPVVKIFKDSL